MMDKILLAVLLALSFSKEVIAQQINDEITEVLGELQKQSALPGFAVSMVRADTILYQRSFGVEVIETEQPFSVTQRFYVASISKTLIGLGLMRLVEAGKLSLSEPVNSVLPFTVTNPYYPDEEITIEQLARHTSGITDDGVEPKSWYLRTGLNLSKKSIGKSAFKAFDAWNQNEKTGLGDFLEECLAEQGKSYTKKRFAKKRPGTHYAYSNLGATLAAHVIELKTGVSYDDYIEGILVEDFGFPPRMWRHKETSILPVSYFQSKVQTPGHVPILYPAGGLMLSCTELTEYLMEMMKGLRGDSEMLTPESFRIMMFPQDDSSAQESGIFWELNGSKIGHNGGNYGATCLMNFDKKTGIGKIFMTNISSYESEDLLQEMIAVWRKIGDFEKRF